MGKPAFDPSKPFQVVPEPTPSPSPSGLMAAKPAFDPSKPFESVPEGPSLGEKIEAGIQGFGNAGLLGYLPQVQAAVGGLMPNPNAKLDAELRAKGFKLPEDNDTYLSRRDDFIKRQEDLQEKAPGSYAVGSVLGTVATTPMYGGAVAKIPGLAAPAAGMMGRIGQAATSGAVTGALQNPGDTKGELNPLQLGDRAKNAATGAAIGGAIQGAAEGVRIIKGIPDFLKESAEKRGASAVGISKAETKRAIMSDPTGMEGHQIKELGKYAMDNGIVKAGDSIESVAQKASLKKKSAGEALGKLYDRASEILSDPKEFLKLSAKDKQAIQATNFITKDMSKEFMDGLASSAKGSAAGNETVNAAKKIISNFNQRPKVQGIKDIQDFKTQLDDIIFKADQAFHKSGIETPNKEAARALRDFLKGKIESRLQAIDSVFGESLGQNLTSLNKDYSQASVISKMAKNKLAGELSNNFFSLTDKMAGLAGAGVGAYEGGKHEGLEGAAKGAALGLVGGIVSKGARTYGRAASAGALNTAAKAVAPVGRVAGAIPGSGLVGGAYEHPVAAGLLGRMANQPENKKK